MKLEARVTHHTGRTRHWIADTENTKGMAENVPIHSIDKVQIQDVEHGFLLLYFDKSGDCLADTWHLTVEEAKEQAKYEFCIEAVDWARLD